MRIAPILIALCILLSFALAEGISEPKLVNELEGRIIESGEIRIVDGRAHEMQVNLTMPQQRPYQLAEYSGATMKDARGNELVGFVQKEPPNPFVYSIETEFTTYGRTTPYLPHSYAVPSSFSPYIEPSPHIQSDDPRIRELAEEITEGATSDFEKIARLAIWAHENIEYDISFVGQKKDSLWVLENREGVCVEYATIFIAMARSLGYPARYVLGQTYGDYGWLGHAWAEVYLGKWVPVDPTWLEAGWLDATHIEFFRSEETEATSKVQAKVTPGASMEWNKPQFSGEETDRLNIDIIRVSNNQPSEEYELLGSAEETGFGTEVIIFLVVEGDTYQVVNARLLPCMGDPLVIEVDEPEQYLILEPGKTSVVSWVLRTSPGLEPGTLYTCPLTLNSNYLSKSTYELKIRAPAPSAGLSASVERPTINLGERQTVYAISDADAQVGYVTGTEYDVRDVKAGWREAFSFTPGSIGPQAVRVFSSLGTHKDLEFTVQKASDIRIETLSVPAYAFVGREFEMNATIRNSAPHQESVELEFWFNNKPVVEHRVLDTGLHRVSSVVMPERAGNQFASVVVKGDGFEGQASIPLTVYELPDVNIVRQEFVSSHGDIVAILNVESSDLARDVTIEVENKVKLPRNGRVTFTLEPDTEYPVYILWKDPQDTLYEKELTLFVPKESEIPKENLPPSSNYAFLVAITIIALIAFALVVTVAVVQQAIKDWN